MREENISEILHDALQYLDDEMIEEVEAIRGGVLIEKSTDLNLQTNPEVETVENPYKDDWKKEFRPWRTWAVLAASVCLFFIVGSAWNNLHQEEIGHKESASDMEVEMEDEIVNNGFLVEDNDGVNETFKEETDKQDDFENESFKDEADKVDKEESALENGGSLADLVKPEGFDEFTLGEWIGLHDYSSVQYQLKDMGSAEKKTVSEENLTIIDKFIDSYKNAYKNGTVRLVDDTSWEDVVKGADGHLYLKLSDGAIIHFVLLGNGVICQYEIPSVWIEIDRRVYDTVLDVLRGEE